MADNIKNNKKANKPKVYIPAYKILITCAVIITICMALLLITTLSSKPKKQVSISERYSETERKEYLNLDDIHNVEYSKVIEDDENEVPIEENENIIIPDTAETKSSNAPKEEVPAKHPEPKTIQQEQTAAPVTVKKKIPQSGFGFPEAENNAQLVFVFDDGGHSLSNVKAFTSLPFPFTVAVLPRLRYSKESADLVRQSGNEVILHQPMQALNLNVDPGPGAITPDMTENEIISTLFQNITEIGPITGMNNHEGSAITSDIEKMSIILKFASQEGIFFLDSRTTADTAVPYVSRALGYSYYERNIFLDNEKTRENILAELKKGLNIANKNGSVIMIGHIWSADILPAVLKEVYPELKKKGYTFSSVSKSKARK